MKCRNCGRASKTLDRRYITAELRAVLANPPDPSRTDVSVWRWVGYTEGTIRTTVARLDGFCDTGCATRYATR